MAHDVTMLPDSDRGQRPQDHEEQYEIVRSIGSGSYGQVFLVFNVREQKQYVMKKIALLATMEMKRRESTELEVKLLSAMRHPTIVSYRDSFVNKEGHLCILMEYCEHGDVYTYLQQAKKDREMGPDEGRILQWFSQVILALHALHEKKILHRDLKTQNIFLTGNRDDALAAKLGDFGISRVLSSTTELAKTQIGTPFYMSPELINNKPYSYKSDVWGLGCVLYEIVNGQRAFDAQSLNGLALKIIKGHFTPITAACSEQTKSLIKSTLSTKPAHRPTLKEILHIPSIRRRIPRALGAVIAARPAENRALTQQVLTEQLAELGLGRLVSRSVRGPKCDRQRIQRRLEQAEHRKRREEEALVRLLKTAKLLTQCLDDRPIFEGAVSLHEPFGGRSGGHFAGVSALEAAHVDERHQRSRALTHRELPRMPSLGEAEDEVLASRSQPRPFGQLHTRTEEASSRLPGLEHVSPARLANPFQSHRPPVVHSPRRSHAAKPTSNPPPPAYGEPAPPVQAPPPASASMWSSWRTSDPPCHPTRPQHSICLRALNIEQRAQADSDDSSSGSLYSEDGLSDVGAVCASGRSNDDQSRLQSQAVKQRIDRCRSAIHRHKMTIGMLQYTCAQERAARAGHEEWVDAGGSESDDSSIGFVRDDAPPSKPSAAAPRPAIVQDCVTRLTRRCLEGLGLEKFQAAKLCLQAPVDAAEAPTDVRQRMLELLGFDCIGFYSLIDQIIHMERKWGATDPT